MYLQNISFIKILDMQAEAKDENKEQIVFHQDYTPPAKILQIMQRISADGRTWIGNGAWQQLRFPQVCQHLDSWPLQTGLGLLGNNRPQILKDLAGIKFPNLKILFLNENSIYSVEWVCKIYLPCLQKVDLSKNNIVSFKGIAKAQLPSLTTIDLNNNHIIEFAPIAQTQMTKLEALQLNSTLPCGQLFQRANGWLMKLETKNLTQLTKPNWIDAYSTSFQKSVKKKYPQINFFFRIIR